MQFLFFYDEVSSSGKVEGKVETQEQVARIVRAGDHMVASDGFRLSGKITKKGTLTGMRWVGCVARVYEEGCLVFEHYQPVTVKELAAKVSGPAVEARRETPPPLPSAKPLSSPSASPASSPDGGATTVLGVAFTAAEAKAALEAANTLSEEDLIRKVGLTRKAAKNVVAARPVAAIGQLPKISYVKAVALAALKNYVSSDEAGK